MSKTSKYEYGVSKPLEPATIESGTLDDPSKPASSADLYEGFFGLWKDRTDIGDSVEFVSRLRSRSQH